MTKEQKEYVTEMDIAIKRMSALIDALLHAARLESGNIAPQKHEVDLTSLITELSEELRDMGKKKRIACTVAVPRTKVLLQKCFPEKVRQERQREDDGIRHTRSDSGRRYRYRHSRARTEAALPTPLPREQRPQARYRRQRPRPLYHEDDYGQPRRRDFRGERRGTGNDVHGEASSEVDEAEELTFSMAEFPDNPQAKPEEREQHDAETPRYGTLEKLRDRFVFNGRHSMVEFADALTTEQRAAVAQQTMAKLQETPQSWEGHLHWMQHATILSVLDRKQFASVADRVETHTQDAIQLLMKGDVSKRDRFLLDMVLVDKRIPVDPNPENPFAVFHKRSVKLYELLTMQPTPEGQRLCEKAFAEWEHQLLKEHTDDMPRFLSEQIAYAQKYEENFLRPFMRTAISGTMDQFAEQEKFPNLRSKLERKGEEFFYTSKHADGKQRRWQVEVYSEGAPILCFRALGDAEPDLVFAVDFVEGLNALEADTARIDRAADKAVRHFAQEGQAEEQKTLRSYDMPRDRTVAHVRLFPHVYDPLVASSLTTSTLLSCALGKRYKGRFVPGPMVFSDDPENALRSEIQRTLEQNHGVKLHFCVDVFSHGSKEDLIFSKPLTAAHLVSIAQEYPQCTFTYNTIACYGGGLMQGIEASATFASDPELRSRIAVFTQSKGDVPNLPAKAAVATMYYAYFLQALNEGKTYGEAHLHADRAVKKFLPVDAEAVIGGRKFVMDRRFDANDALLS